MYRILPFVVLLGCANASSTTPPVDAEDVLPEIDAPVSTVIDAPIAMPDGNGCATQPCEIISQCGCAATQACDIDGSDLDGGACRPVTTPGQVTSTCDTADDCDRGFVCLGSSAGRSCRKYCEANTDCTAPRGQCVVDIVSGTTPVPNIPSVCSSGCDPTNVAAGGCPASWKCNVYTATHNAMTYNITDCDPSVGALGQGGNCKVGTEGDDALCSANHLCTTIDAGTNFGCRKICNRAASNCGALTCIAFNPALTVGGTEYGVCN